MSEMAEVKQLYTIGRDMGVVSVRVDRETAKRYYVKERYSYPGCGSGSYVASFTYFVGVYIEKDDPAWFHSPAEAARWGRKELSDLVQGTRERLLVREADLAAFDKQYGVEMREVLRNE